MTMKKNDYTKNNHSYLWVIYNLKIRVQHSRLNNKHIVFKYNFKDILLFSKFKKTRGDKYRKTIIKN